MTFRPRIDQGRSRELLPRAILIITPSLVFSEAFSLWCRRYVDVDLVNWAVCFEHGRELCSSFRQGLLVADPGGERDSINKSLAFVRDGLVDQLLLLDARPQEATLATILREPRTSYFSRMASSQSLAAAMAQITIGRKRVFDPSFAGRLLKTERGYELIDTAEGRSISALTGREREVMRLLAHGNSVKHCSELLRIAESTVENHKSRLMKKLGIHKSAELTLHAVRCGLVTL